MATLQIFNSFTEALAEKQHNLGADTLKWMLSDTAPSAANAVPGDITEIAAANGYSAGGFTAAVSSSSQTGGVYTLATSAASVTASGGTVGPFRYPVLYNSTASLLIGWLDYGSDYTLPDGQPFTIPAQTVLTLQAA